MQRRFEQVDVFGSTPLGGNPLAVVVDAGDLEAEVKQAFARWTNLSETTFLLPPASPDADYLVRNFTPNRELPFAGHPTLGSCHTWLASGGQPARAELIVQECGAGLVSIRRAGGRLAFAAPPLIRSGPVDSGLVDELAIAVGVDRSSVVDAQWVDNGPGWVGLLLAGADAVLDARPDLARIDWTGDLDIGLVGPYPPGAPCAIEVRALYRDDRGATKEDPVTGSLNASLAQWLLGTGRVAAPYVASQGTRLGREGQVHVTQEGDGTIWVGGTTTTCVSGNVEL
jgi:PhzF family phenazine biosynthesis protein